MSVMTTLSAPTGHPSYTLTLPCEPEKSREARQLVIHALAAWGLEHLCDQATLAMAELFTNTLEHTSCRFARVVIARTEDRTVRVAVVDRAASAKPVRRAANTTTEDGRGLMLVEAVSTRWGVDRLGWGKRVWCEFACTC